MTVDLPNSITARVTPAGGLPIEQLTFLVELRPNVALAQSFLGSEYCLDAGYLKPQGKRFLVKGHKQGQCKDFFISLQLTKEFATKVLGEMGMSVNQDYKPAIMSNGMIIVQVTGPAASMELAQQHPGLGAWKHDQLEPSRSAYPGSICAAV